MEGTGRIGHVFFEEVSKTSPSFSKGGRLLLLREEGTKKPLGNDCFDPGKYGMVICGECHGTGKSSNGPEEESVCSTCGGFGLTKKKD
jgi:hypothetical protein